jgi:hypothetical protein
VRSESEGRCAPEGGKDAEEDKRSLVQRIADLKEEQKRQRVARSTVAKALKRSLRKKRSLQKQAANLSRDDLLSVIFLREEKAKKESRAGSSSKDAAREQQASKASTDAMSCSQMPPQDSGIAGEPFAQAAPTDAACEPFAQADLTEAVQAGSDSDADVGEEPLPPLRKLARNESAHAIDPGL